MTYATASSVDAASRQEALRKTLLKVRIAGRPAISHRAAKSPWSPDRCHSRSAPLDHAPGFLQRPPMARSDTPGTLDHRKFTGFP